MPNQKDIVTPSSIVNQFVNNVNAVILNGASDQNSPPLFNGSVVYNNDYTNPNYSAAFINPPAIPVADLDFKSNAVGSTASIGSVGTVVTGVSIYNTLVDLVRKLTRVRNFSSAWYHQTGSSYALITTSSGRAMFKESLPAVQGTGGIAANTPTSGWARSINGTTTQAISVANPGIAKGSSILASSINSFFTNLNNSWAAAAVNTISYTFYSCHANCHNNCHSSCHSSGRSRR